MVGIKAPLSNPQGPSLPYQGEGMRDTYSAVNDTHVQPHHSPHDNLDSIMQPQTATMMNSSDSKLAVKMLNPNANIFKDPQLKTSKDHERSLNTHSRSSSGQSRQTKRSSTAIMQNRGSADLRNTNNNIFYAPPKNVLNTKARTWKSASTKLQQEYARMRRLVAHIAPEQFHNASKPSSGPCGIVPSTIQEYRAHREAMAEMSGEHMKKNIKSMKDQITMRQIQRPIKSILGDGGKVYQDGLSPVLCVPTVWSLEHHTVGFPSARWPTQSELQLDGDDREKFSTRCGRFFPQPRLQLFNNSTYPEILYFPISTLDQIGPIRAFCPGPKEVEEANLEFDNSSEFGNAGLEFLGAELMAEIDD